MAGGSVDCDGMGSPKHHYAAYGFSTFLQVVALLLAASPLPHLLASNLHQISGPPVSLGSISN